MPPGTGSQNRKTGGACPIGASGRGREGWNRFGFVQPRHYESVIQGRGRNRLRKRYRSDPKLGFSAPVRQSRPCPIRIRPAVDACRRSPPWRSWSRWSARPAARRRRSRRPSHRPSLRPRALRRPPRRRPRRGRRVRRRPAIRRGRRDLRRGRAAGHRHPRSPAEAARRPAVHRRDGAADAAHDRVRSGHAAGLPGRDRAALQGARADPGRCEPADPEPRLAEQRRRRLLPQ